MPSKIQAESMEAKALAEAKDVSTTTLEHRAGNFYPDPDAGSYLDGALARP